MEWEELKEPLYKFIVENRSMFRDDGVDKGQGDIIDFINATVTKTGRKITVDAHGWGGWPLYDYIVDDDWADTGFPEGTVINTYTGTKIYSTIQGAVDAWSASAADKSIFICPGHYDEDVVVATDIVQRISIEGGSGCTAFIDGSITFDGQFNNYLTYEWRPPSVIRNLKVSDNVGGGKGAGDLIFGQTVVHEANVVDGLCFENCHFEGTLKGIYHTTTTATTIHRCSFLNCTFGSVDDNDGVFLLWECHFEGCTFQSGFDIHEASGATTSGIGYSSTSPPCTFTDCYFRKGTRIGDVKAGIFTVCTFEGLSTGSDNSLWISGGDGAYGPDIGSAIFDGCHFMYGTGTNAEFGFVKLGDTQTIGAPTWENFIVSNCTFDVPNAPTAGTNPIHAVWWVGEVANGHIPKIVFANNALIEDTDGNRLEDLTTTPASTTVEGVFRDSVFGPNEPPNFNIDLGAGSANNIYIGTGTVVGAGASSVTIIGGGGSGTTSGILYDSAALTLGYRAFLCRFDTTIVTVAAGTLALTNTATNYVEVDAAGTVSANTTAYTLGHIPLGTVVCAGGDITTITEQSATLDESATNIFTAQSVLAATTAHTPAALTLTEQTVVGRLTGGNIAAVSLGIADNNVVQIDQADAADNDYAKFTAAGIEGRSYAEVKADLDLEAADISAAAIAAVEGEATLDLTGAVTVAGASLGVDHIVEHTATHGVDIDGVLLKDDAVETDAIRGLRETSGPTALTVGTITDGEYLKRVGATVVSGTPAGGGATDILSERATQAIAANTTVAVTDGTPLTPFTTTGNITNTAAPFIAAGREGQLVILRNDNGSGTLTISDTNIGVGGSLLRLSANTLTMAAGSSLALVYSTIQGAWVEEWYLALVAVTPSINSFTINIGAGASNSQNAEVANAGTDTPTMAWTYTGVPSAGTVDVSAGGDPAADYPATILTPFTSLVAPAYNKGTAVSTTRTFTPTITVNGTPLSTPTATVTYINRRYMGPSSQAAALTSAQVLGLDAAASGESGLSTIRTGSFTDIDTAAGEYIWYAYRAALGAGLYFAIESEIAGFTEKQTTLSHTNDSGFVEDFRTWRSDLANFGDNKDVDVATSAGNNRFYMGPSTDTDPISNANILALDDTADGESGLYSTQARTWTAIKIEAGEYLWYCHPDRIADLATIKDGTTGFAIAGSYRTTVSHTNQYGYVEDYRCWRSDNTGIYPTGENIVIT